MKQKKCLRVVSLGEIFQILCDGRTLASCYYALSPFRAPVTENPKENTNNSFIADFKTFIVYLFISIENGILHSIPPS